MTYEDLSQRILHELQADGRQSLRELGEKLDVSPTTVGNRIDELREDGVLKGITADIDYEKLGYAYMAITRFKVVGDSIDRALDLLGEHPQLTDIYEITGNYDILAVGHFLDRDRMNEIVKSLQSKEAIRETNTSIILNAYRENGALPLDELD
jgi:DNA-binding Lrp family transcriptional regulator